MENNPPPKPAESLNYASPGAFPRRKFVWAWVVAALIGMVVFFSLLWAAIRPSPRVLSPRIKSASNLRQVGQAILLYTNDFQGRYPDTFGDLLLTEDITSEVFVAPLSSDTVATGPTTQATIANFVTPGHCSYVYLGKGLIIQTLQPTMVIAYEPPAINAGQGGNVLFGDGHVAFVNMAGMNSILNQINSGVWPVYLPAMPATAPATRPGKS